MIRVATIGYGRLPDFDVNPHGTLTIEAGLAWAMLSRPQFREASEKEGLKVDWARLKRIAGVVVGEQKRKRDTLSTKL